MFERNQNQYKYFRQRLESSEYDWYKDETYDNTQHETFSSNTYGQFTNEHESYFQSNLSRTHGHLIYDRYDDENESYFESNWCTTSSHTDSNVHHQPKHQLKFSGLKIDHDQQTNDVEYFLHHICIYMHTMKISNQQMLTDIPLFLYGPALNWYTITEQSIRSWDLFTHEFRKRFSPMMKIDDKVINHNKMSSDSNIVDSDSPNNSRVQSPIISFDEQPSLATSVMETLPQNTQDDSSIHPNEICKILSGNSFNDMHQRLCKDLPKLHSNIWYKSPQVNANRMNRNWNEIVSTRCNSYGENRAIAEGVKILFRNFKKRKKKKRTNSTTW